MKKTIAFPKGILFDMDGVLLTTIQSSDQSWHLAYLQFASRLNRSPQRLEEALRQSRHAYKSAIEQDPQMQRRDRLEPFETRSEMVERALEQVRRADRTLASEMVRTYEAFRDEYRQLAPYALETLQKLRDRALGKCPMT